MKLELNEQEGNELIKLLDLAVKFQGLIVAGSCQYFHDKLKKAFEEEKAALVMQPVAAQPTLEVQQ